MPIINVKHKEAKQQQTKTVKRQSSNVTMREKEYSKIGALSSQDKFVKKKTKVTDKEDNEEENKEIPEEERLEPESACDFTVRNFT